MFPQQYCSIAAGQHVTEQYDTSYGEQFCLVTNVPLLNIAPVHTPRHLHILEEVY